MMSKIDELFAGVEEQKKSREARVEGNIVKIEVGKIGDWIPKEKLNKPEQADRDAIQLNIEVPDGYNIRQVMTVSSHPNSNLQKYLVKYGKYPAVGDKYPVEYSKRSGFWEGAQLCLNKEEIV